MGRLPVRRTCLRADTHRKTQTWRHSRLSISEGGHVRPKTEGLREVERQSKSALAEWLSIGNQHLAAKRKTNVKNRLTLTVKIKRKTEV